MTRRGADEAAAAVRRLESCDPEFADALRAADPVTLIEAGLEALARVLEETGKAQMLETAIEHDMDRDEAGLEALPKIDIRLNTAEGDRVAQLLRELLVDRRGLG